jgi:hypothetical protein
MPEFTITIAYAKHYWVVIPHGHQGAEHPISRKNGKFFLCPYSQSIEHTSSNLLGLASLKSLELELTTKKCL